MSCHLLRAVAVVFTLAALPAAADDSPFHIDERDFKRQYEVIALAPVNANDYLQMPEAAARQIEAEVTEELEREGFTVIPSSVLAGIRDTMAERVGGLTDPGTGDARLTFPEYT